MSRLAHSWLVGVLVALSLFAASTGSRASTRAVGHADARVFAHGLPAEAPTPLDDAKGVEDGEDAESGDDDASRSPASPEAELLARYFVFHAAALRPTDDAEPRHLASEGRFGALRPCHGSSVNERGPPQA